MKGALLPPLNISNTGVHIRALSLESLMEEHHWVLNQFVKIFRSSIIVCLLYLSEKFIDLRLGDKVNSGKGCCTGPPGYMRS